MPILLLTALLVFAVAAITEADVKSEITALLQEQDEAWNRGDLAGFVKPYDGSGRLVFVGSKGIVRDPQTLKEHYEKSYHTGKDSFGKLSFSGLEVEELADGLARAWGKWEVVQKEKRLSGWFSLLLMKTPSGWRIIHDHSS